MEIAALRSHHSWVWEAAFSPDGTRIVTGSADRTARVWDAASGRLLHTLEGHDAPVFSTAFSPDGRRVVTASDDRTVRLWDAASGREIASVQPGWGAVVTASADGTAGTPRRALAPAETNALHHLAMRGISAARPHVLG